MLADLGALAPEEAPEEAARPLFAMALYGITHVHLVAGALGLYGLILAMGHIRQVEVGLINVLLIVALRNTKRIRRSFCDLQGA